MKNILKDIAFFLALLVFAVFMINPVYVKSNSAAAATTVAQSYLKKQSSIEQFYVTEAQFWIDGRHIQFTYNVKPTESGMDKWTEDGGTQTDDGWVQGKTGFITYYKIGNFYVTGLSLKLKLPS